MQLCPRNKPQALELDLLQPHQINTLSHMPIIRTRTRTRRHALHILFSPMLILLP